MATQLRESRRKFIKLRQACDCCRNRKIRCNATEPCRNCEASELSCTYLSVPKKKGPKGPRLVGGSRTMKRMIELLEKGDTSPVPYVTQNIASRGAGQCKQPVGPGNEGFQPWPLITTNIIKSCINAFFTSKYPIMPILDHEQVYATLTSLHDSLEQYRLITAICIVATLQLEVLKPVSSGDFLLVSSEVVVASLQLVDRASHFR